MSPESIRSWICFNSQSFQTEIGHHPHHFRGCLSRGFCQIPDHLGSFRVNRKHGPLVRSGVDDKPPIRRSSNARPWFYRLRCSVPQILRRGVQGHGDAVEPFFSRGYLPGLHAAYAGLPLKQGCFRQFLLCQAQRQPFLPYPGPGGFRCFRLHSGVLPIGFVRTPQRRDMW